jgi:hypothetical protein
VTPRRWTALAVFWITGITIGWAWYFSSQAREEDLREAQTQAWRTAAQQIAGVAPDGVPSRVQADAKRLMTDVRALAFERKSEAARAKARGYVAHALQRIGYRPELQSFLIKDAQGAQQGGVNLVVHKPGTDPKAGAWLIGAHYDTVGGSMGADDNATGVAAVMEIARLLKDVPLKQTLRFVFFDQEESGMLGSIAYARSDIRIQDLKGAIIAEMLGYKCVTEGCQRMPAGLPIAVPKVGDFAAVVGDTPAMLKAFGQAEQPATPVVALLVPDRGRLMPNTRRSDHAPFWDRGVPALMVSDTADLRNPHYHLPGDVPETLDAAFLRGSTQLIVDALLRLAR